MSTSTDHFLKEDSPVEHTRYVTTLSAPSTTADLGLRSATSFTDINCLNQRLDYLSIDLPDCFEFVELVTKWTPHAKSAVRDGKTKDQNLDVEKDLESLVLNTILDMDKIECSPVSGELALDVTIDDTEAAKPLSKKVNDPSLASADTFQNAFQPRSQGMHNSQIFVTLAGTECEAQLDFQSSLNCNAAT